MIPAAVFHVVAVLGGHGQSAGAWSACLAGAELRASHGAGRGGAERTHSKPS
jgi:hypothetical protein